MGIYDREYYRRETRSSLLPSGQVCHYLIVVNIVLFVLQLATLRSEISVTNLLILSPQDVLHGEIWRLITYAFIHDPGNWVHIFFNMLFLWWFGSDVEDLYGPWEFLTFYLTSALLGGIFFSVWQMTQARLGAVLGASGAVTAVMVLYALHYPTRTILVWFVVPVQIWIFVLFQVAQDTFIFASGINSRTAVTVHLAGAAFGFLYYKLQWRLLNLWPNFRMPQLRSQPRLRVYSEEEDQAKQSVTVAAPPSPRVDEHLEAQLDAILEKVARQGQQSLTEQEREILIRASEAYKKRRH